MSIALDGFKVLKRLGDAPEAFASVRVDVDKSARALVVKCLKAKSTSLQTARAIHTALHDKQFELLVDGLKPAEIKSLLTQLDKHHPGLKTMSAPDQRRHLLALTRGEAEASLPPTKAAKASKTKAPKTAKAAKSAKPKAEEPKRLQSDVMDLFRARGQNRDDED